MADATSTTSGIDAGGVYMPPPGQPAPSGQPGTEALPTFLDALQQSRTQLSQLTPGVGQTSGATERATQILQAKSGKAAAPGGLGQSNIGEQIAAQNAGQQLQSQIQPQLQIQQTGQNQQAQAEGQQAQNQAAAIGQARDFNNVQYKMQVASTLQQLRQGMGQLSEDKQNAMLQQASFLMGMQNKQYTTQLQQIGQMKNLTDKMSTLNEIQDLVFGSNVQILQQQLGQQNVLMSSKRDFQNSMANMSMQDAQKIADMETQSRQQMAQLQAQQLRYGAQLQSNLASTGAMGQGISGVISGAAQAEKAYSNAQDRAQAAQDRQSLKDVLQQQKDASAGTAFNSQGNS